jgi:hypothetical protein
VVVELSLSMYIDTSPVELEFGPVRSVAMLIGVSLYELQPSLVQKKDMGLVNRESAKHDNTGNSDPVTTHPESDTNSHSIE